MARSKKIDDAIMDACGVLVSTLMDEIKNSFSPYSTVELPFLIFAMRSIYTALRERHPEAAQRADELAVVFRCVATEVRTGKRGESDV